MWNTRSDSDSKALVWGWDASSVWRSWRTAFFEMERIAWCRSKRCNSQDTLRTWLHGWKFESRVCTNVVERNETMYVSSIELYDLVWCSMLQRWCQRRTDSGSEAVLPAPAIQRAALPVATCKKACCRVINWTCPDDLQTLERRWSPASLPLSLEQMKPRSAAPLPRSLHDAASSLKILTQSFC